MAVRASLNEISARMHYAEGRVFELERTISEMRAFTTALIEIAKPTTAQIVAAAKASTFKDQAT